LKNLLYDPAHAEIDLSELPEEFRDLGSGMLYLGQCVNEVRDFTRAMSKGDLDDIPLASGNELASGLKSLNASLKHLTWQAQQIAKGDYTQRVGFMGEFSEAVNNMVEQLDERQRNLEAEVEANKRKSDALLQSNSLFEAITQTMSQWIVMVDRNSGEWLFSNHDAGVVLRSIEVEPQIRDWILYRAQRGRDAAAPAIETGESEVGLTDSTGATQYFSVSTYYLTWYEHEAIAFVFSDVTSDKERFNSLENIAYRDTLTNTYNRHYGMNLLNDWLANKERFIVCFVDMDNLKFVNDRYGHAEGDTYILNVTAILKRFDIKAVVCRLGGDEFMLLCLGWTLQDAEERLENLRSELMVSNEGVTEYKQSLSYGCIAVDETNTIPASELLTIADEKMYIYKRAHKADRRG
jgi:diguanylate cyclase (GGDEF)-like protein